MSTTIITKTSAFTIADSDLGVGDNSISYHCTGVFAITIPSTGVGAGGEFVIISTDSLQTFTDNSSSNRLPAHRELVLYPVATGEHATVVITCKSTGVYTTTGDLNPTEWGEISFRAHSIVNQSITSGGTVNFEVVDYDNGSVYNNTTNKFTAPQDGTYKFNAIVTVDALSDGKFMQARLLKNTAVILANGTRVPNGTGVAASVRSVAVDQVELLQGDTVYVLLSHDEGANLNTSESLYNVAFSGHLVGGTKGDTGDFGSAVYQSEVSFQAYMATTMTAQTSGVWHTVEYDTVTQETTTGLVDTATHRFTAPNDGSYQINTFCYLDNVGSGNYGHMQVLLYNSVAALKHTFYGHMEGKAGNDMITKMSEQI